jgi:restriction endonuclease Mrr
MGCASAVLCALYWIEHVDRRTDATLQTLEQPAGRVVSASEIAALYGSHAGRRLREVAGFLTRLARGGLVETVGRGWYHTTALGRAVVHAFPNRVEVARLRHVRVGGARRGV